MDSPLTIQEQQKHIFDNEFKTIKDNENKNIIEDNSFENGEDDLNLFDRGHKLRKINSKNQK